MEKVIGYIKKTFSKISKNEYVKAFFIIYILGVLAFSIEAASNHFTLPMGGDYTLQTYAFYSQGYHIFWNFIKTGEYPLFDFSNYLGANYLGTQSFYYVFSPLFYILCLCPEKFLYQGIFFHMVLKFAVGGFFMYILLRKYFHVSFKMSWIGGFIYAFSGWALFYLWFHFGDVMAFFPVFIMGIEKCLKERKGGLLAIGTFLCGMSNYFFLVNFCLFGACYALYRWIYIYGINKKKGFSAKVRFGVLLQGVLYCIVGVAMAGICLLPSLQVAMSTERTKTSEAYMLDLLRIFFVNPSNKDGLILGEAKTFKEIMSLENIKAFFTHLFVWNGERKIGSMTIPGKVNVGYIISSWLYMNTNCWDNVMFDNASLDNSIGGFFITTPLTMLLIPSIAKTIKSKRPWEIFGLIVCLALPFFPITAHIAFGFTSLYGRWQLWIVLIGIIYIIPTLDRFEEIDRRLVTVNLIFNFALAVIVYFISKENGKLPTDYIVINKTTKETLTLFGYKISGMVLVTIIELAVMILVWVIYRFKFFKPALVKKLIMLVVVIEVGASIVVTVEHKGYADWETYYLSQPEYQELTNVIYDLKEEDDQFYRVMNTEATRSIMNLPSALNYNGASSFNSTYSFALDKFKNNTRMAYGGGWTMGNHEKRYWLDQYIGTKYYIIDKNDPNNDNPDYSKDETKSYNGRFCSTKEEEQNYRLNLGWNYELYKEYDNYDVYINNDFIGIGYTVDNYIKDAPKLYSTNTSLNAPQYEELYATTAIIYEKDIEYVSENATDSQQISSYAEKSRTFTQRDNWNLYFSPREDYNKAVTGELKREEYPVDKFTKANISKHLPSNSQFLHKRWTKYGFFGDQLIYKLKDGKKPLAADATDDNLCYINIYFKLGPKVLISFYNDDVLVTQDAHSYSRSSLSDYNYEWKTHRGFYLNQPVNKIVIEYIEDTKFNQAFQGGTTLEDITIKYMYQDEIEQMQQKIQASLLTDVKYKNNKFTFKSNSEGKKIAVTNIPFDEGWKLTKNGKPCDIFDVNGGFVGFITDDGLTNYELRYFTPNLKEGLALSLGGLILFIVLAYVYKNKKVSILMVETQIANVYLQKQEKEENEYLQKIEEKVKKIKIKIRDKFKKK